MVHSAPPVLRVLGPDDGDALWFLGSLATVKVSATDTSGRLTVVEFVNPPGFAPPLHRHRVEDEMFAVLEGEVTFFCDGRRLPAGAGDFVVLPAGLPHSFLVGPDAPLRSLQITTPGGFEAFAAAVGAPATERRLPDPEPLDPAALAHAADLHGVDIVGPPPTG